MRPALPWFLLLPLVCSHPVLASVGDTGTTDSNAVVREPRPGRFGLGAYRKVAVPHSPAMSNQAAQGVGGEQTKELRFHAHADLALVGFGAGFEAGGEHVLGGLEVMRLASVASGLDASRSTSLSIMAGIPLSRLSSLQAGIGLLTGEHTGLHWGDGLSTRSFSTVNLPIRAVVGFAGRNAGLGLRVGRISTRSR